MARNRTKKPQIRIVRNVTGSIIVSLFGILCDLILLFDSTKLIVKKQMFLKASSILPSDRNIIIVALISFLACLLSCIFMLAVLFYSGLTMQKGKRIKALPFLIFAFFKALYKGVVYNTWKDYTFLLIKDILLYICISHTAKNMIVRKFFKPFKQIVEYQ